MLSPMSATQDLILNLIAISAPPRDVTFNQSMENYLISNSEVIYMIDLYLHPQRKVTLPEIFLSSLYDFLVPAPFYI